jgi:hypothetical protein
MIRLLIDQNFNEHIIVGLVRRGTTLDLVRVRDVGLSAARMRRFLNGPPIRVVFCLLMTAEQSHVLLTLE